MKITVENDNYTGITEYSGFDEYTIDAFTTLLDGLAESPYNDIDKNL